MKKSLLALAVLGAFAGAAQAQSSVTIYGIVDTGIAYTSKAVNTTTGNTGSKFGLNSGVIQGSRIGFKGVEDLGGGLSAVFNLEAGFKNDTGALDDTKTTNTLFRRKSVVGLQGGFGSVLLGRQTDFADTISAYTSVADFGGVTGAVGHNLDRLEGTRTNNSISYTTANLSGFTGNLIYGFGETAGQTSAGQAFGIGGKYDNGPLGLGLNYYQSKQGSTPSDTSLLSSAGAGDATNAGNSAAKVLNVVASYQFGPARVYGNWSRVKQDLSPSVTTTANQTLANANKADVYELGTAYSLSPSLKLLASVQHTRASFKSVDGKGKLTQINLGTDYWLSKRTDLYAFVSNIRASDMINTGVYGDTTGSDASQTAVAVGIRHKF
ncbi:MULTISPECIES: porin [unclassified Herbaspirillum]|uniref:porin n=1 Tax=unclassified Herbaspirillum TaxID=2624150 RepID=UPI0011535234|nr:MULTISPECIES: porin [unclassified Herbaspirillum]MBB5390230.1 putative porin [Herbaspirillum sp. SJZ102]TQK09272.1 putative porin [Herbaspirillum sp. SJZ130]TQK14041.1 putative porin [Herbaspirillum sp. SJZ106]